MKSTKPTVTNMQDLKAPFPYFGGKSRVAHLVWGALGDVNSYVEPFGGSLAVLLRRPHPINRGNYSETVNDLDHYVVNFWRAVVADPDGVATEASWPVSELDLLARHLWLVRWSQQDGLRDRFAADPAYHDVRAAGWWAWGLSCWIGSGWCSGEGPWIISDGKLTKQGRKPRKPGTDSKLPHLGDDGKGVNYSDIREPGVASQLPHLGDDGKGVNYSDIREPGVASQLPHLGDDGQGVNSPGLREPGVALDFTPHPMVMPRMRQWIGLLAARLRHVRVTHGSWDRVCGGSVTKPLSVRGGGKSFGGVFLDPPYELSSLGGCKTYTEHDMSLSSEVRRWCLDHGADPKLRIVLAGFDHEHGELESHGWRVVNISTVGQYLSGGYGNRGKAGTRMHLDRLWLSPHCLDPAAGEPT